MRLFLTGACGFIGRHLCLLAPSHGFEVYGYDVVDDPPTVLPADRFFSQTSAGRTLAETVAHVRPQVCIHAAGRASVADSVKDPSSDFAAGPVLTFSLLEALRRGAPECRFLFLSSAAVYGNPAALPISEESATSPISPYGFHKLQCEALCKEFTHVFGLRTAVVRIFSAYGEGLRRQVLWDICHKLLKDGRMTLRGTGEETRDFIHVRDLCDAVLTVVRAARMQGEVYNLASGRATTIRELAGIVASALGQTIVPSFDGQVPEGDPRFWQADTRLIRELGFVPKMNLEEGVAAYAEWCREQLR